MHLAKRDLIATGLVLVAGLVYLLWAMDATLPGMSGTRVSGVVVLALGFAASASAVVPGFDALLHGNKAYLAMTVLIGLVAFVGGLAMLISASAAGFTVTMAAMIVLWVISTVHHGMLAAPQPHRVHWHGAH
jgi:hypothetical protein